MDEATLEAGVKYNQEGVLPCKAGQTRLKGSTACLPPYAVTGGVFQGPRVRVRSLEPPSNHPYYFLTVMAVTYLLNLQTKSDSGNQFCERRHVISLNISHRRISRRVSPAPDAFGTFDSISE